MKQKIRNRGIPATAEGIEKLEAAKIKKGWSYDKLATEAQLSADTVERIIKGVPVGKESIRKIATALNLQPTDIVAAQEWNPPLKKTAGKRTSNTSGWQTICSQMLNSQKQQLRQQVTQIGCELDVYVPLGLVERKHQSIRNGDNSLSPEQGSDFFQLTEEEIIQTYEHNNFLEEVIQQGQSKKSKGKRIAIIGEPGAGKTTLLEAIAFYKKLSYLPIWISLKSLGDKSLEQYLSEIWLKDALKNSDFTQNQKDLEEVFKSRKVLLLLDGVDEMPASSPVDALVKIRNYLTGWVADARIVLTCRVNVWEASVNSLQGFDIYRTLDFSYGDGDKLDQVKQFICEWFIKAEKPQLGEPLREKLDEDRHQRIRDLVKNPLRLSLLCQSWYFKQGDLPETKAALYEQFRRASYEWKNEPFPTSLTERKNLNTALGILAREAIDREKSRFAIRESFAVDVMGEDLFNLACKLHWLNFVYKDADTDEKVYAFFHPTFQEYFAACAIDDWHYFLNHNNENPNPFLKYNGKDCVYRIFEPQWKAVFLLWLGRKDVVKENKDKFIQALIEFEDDCWDLYWYRSFFLAGAGIGEFTCCIYADEIVERLIDWTTENKPTSRFEKLINIAAWKTLRETDITRVINALIKVLFKEFIEPQKSLEALDNDIWWRVFNTLKEIAISNSEAISVISDWMNNILLDEDFLYEDLRNIAALLLGYISTNKREPIEFLKQQLVNHNLPEYARYQAAHFLIEIDNYNPDAIEFWTDCFTENSNHQNRFEAAQALGKIDSSKSIVVKSLTELLNSNQDYNCTKISLLSACQLIDIESENSEAIRVIMNFIQDQEQQISDRIMAANYLGKTLQCKQESIRVLYNLLDEIMNDETIEDSQRLFLGDQAIMILYEIEPSLKERTLSLDSNNDKNIINVNSYQEQVPSIVYVERLLEELKFSRRFYTEDSWNQRLSESLSQFWIYTKEILYPEFYKSLHPESPRLQAAD
jgi:lambda repressor-like predicted transcriptional regulator